MKGRLLISFALLLLVLGACGDDGDTADVPADVVLTNSCPVDGCSITIDNVVPEGDELRITWSANFAPDFSKNHVHLYWDNFTAEQVSANAESEYRVAQGTWLPTDAFPSLLTEGEVSVSQRGESTTLCVTAADFDHNVLNVDLVQCTDVSGSL
jgi:hypothetical protein